MTTFSSEEEAIDGVFEESATGHLGDLFFPPGDDDDDFLSLSRHAETMAAVELPEDESSVTATDSNPLPGTFVQHLLEHCV